MHELQCGEVWGGVNDRNEDVGSAGVVASLYCDSSDGGKGGDIYYLSLCESGKLTRVAVADVVGHGQAVSKVSEWLYRSLRRRMNSVDSESVLADLNERACTRGIEALTTAVVIGFYRDEDRVFFANAGTHPFLVRRAGETEWLAPPDDDTPADGTADVPLGLSEDSRYLPHVLPLRTGDRVIIYTDGVTEAPNADREAFGRDRLLDVLRDAGDRPVAELKAAVVDAVRSHTGGTLDHDDLTVLVAEAR